jgi:hypothetical protein
MDDARDWATSAMLRRPRREHFFDCFVAELAALNAGNFRLIRLEFSNSAQVQGFSPIEF